MYSIILSLSVLHAPLPPVSQQAHHKEILKPITKEYEIEMHLSRFPSREVAHQWYMLAGQYIDDIEKRLGSGLLMTDAERNEWGLYLNEIRGRQNLWYYLREAQVATDWYPGQKQDMLNNLRESLGEHRFWSGYIPPPVDPEKFWLID
jgi:hypothetical protein